MKTLAQINAKIKLLKAKIELLEKQKDVLVLKKKLNKDGYFIASDFARELGVSRQYICNNKHKFSVIEYQNKEYFKKR